MSNYNDNNYSAYGSDDLNSVRQTGDHGYHSSSMGYENASEGGLGGQTTFSGTGSSVQDTDLSGRSGMDSYDHTSSGAGGLSSGNHGSSGFGTSDHESHSFTGAGDSSYSSPSGRLGEDSGYDNTSSGYGSSAQDEYTSSGTTAGVPPKGSDSYGQTSKNIGSGTYGTDSSSGYGTSKNVDDDRMASEYDSGNKSSTGAGYDGDNYDKSSSSTAGVGAAGYGNKTSSHDHSSSGKKQDSTAGKLMEKVGSVFKSDSMIEKGAAKREQAGAFNDDKNY